MNDRRSTAWHEAGHAVAAVVLYPPGALLFAYVYPAGPRGPRGPLGEHGVYGRTYACPWAFRARGVRAFGVFSYAGMAGEAIGELGRLPPMPSNEIMAGGDTDFDNLEHFAARRGRDRPANRWHSPSWSHAGLLLARHAKALERVADTLYRRRHGKIEGEEVEEIVAACRVVNAPRRSAAPAPELQGPSE